MGAFYVTKSADFAKLEQSYRDMLKEYSAQMTVKSDSSPSMQADTFEPNNNMGEAFPVNLGTSYTSYISYTNDSDYYKFVAPTSGTITIQLQVPLHLDYDFYILDEYGNNVGYGDYEGNGGTERVTLSVNAGKPYYIWVVGFSLISDPNYPYVLNIGQIVTGSPFIYLNSPVDVDVPQGSYSVFRYTPTETGTYQIFTGPYGGFGGINDTILELYTDATLTNLISISDDWNNTP